MSERDKLNEAYYTVDRGESGWPQQRRDDYADGYEFARREILEHGEEIEWCEMHGASVVEELNGCGGSDLGEHCDRTPSLRIPMSALRDVDPNEEK